MKNIKYLSLTSVFALPFVASAAATLDATGEAAGFLGSILVFINTVLVPFILGIAFLFFVWGMFQYFIAGGANDEAKEKGKSLLTYSIVGFVVILAFWGIITLVVDGLGLGGGAIGTTPVGPVI